MPTQDLIKISKKFLKENDFVKVHWDGTEISAYGSNGEVFGKLEFRNGSITRSSFVVLEEECFGHDPFTVEL